MIVDLLDDDPPTLYVLPVNRARTIHVPRPGFQSNVADLPPVSGIVLIATQFLPLARSKTMEPPTPPPDAP